MHKKKVKKCHEKPKYNDDVVIKNTFKDNGFVQTLEKHRSITRNEKVKKERKGGGVFYPKHHHDDFFNDNVDIGIGIMSSNKIHHGRIG